MSPSDPSKSEIDDILSRFAQGEAAAGELLFSRIYDELRSLARSFMAHERDGHTLQTTALVNEACIRMISLNRTTWTGRAHFLRVAARAMRRILIDHARARKSRKRGGGEVMLPLEEVQAEGAGLFAYPSLDLIALDTALDRLEALDERKARIVELLCFAGLTVVDTAQVLGVTRRTVHREWQFARLWLIRAMNGTPGSPPALRGDS